MSSSNDLFERFLAEKEDIDFSSELYRSIKSSIIEAKTRGHEYITIEHILLSLMEDNTVLECMKALNADAKIIKSQLLEYIDTELTNLALGNLNADEWEPKLTAGSQRVIARAIVHVQSSNRSVINGSNILVSILAERESHAAYFLNENDVTRYDVVNWIVNGIAKGETNEENYNQDQIDVNLNILDEKPSDYKNKLNTKKPKSKAKEKTEKDRAIRVIKTKIKTNADDHIAIANGLSRLAQLEIKEIRSQRPNSIEAIQAKDAQLKLMNIFLDGFKIISQNLEEAKSKKYDKKSLDQATKSIVSLSEALENWWEANNQKVINFAIGSPLVAASFAAMKALGAGFYIEALVTSATASMWFGGGLIKSAIASAKEIKKSQD